MCRKHFYSEEKYVTAASFDGACLSFYNVKFKLNTALRNQVVLKNDSVGILQFRSSFVIAGYF